MIKKLYYLFYFFVTPCCDYLGGDYSLRERKGPRRKPKNGKDADD